MSVDHPDFGEQRGRFFVEGQIGAGGTADVYLARDQQSNRHVAIKVAKAQANRTLFDAEIEVRKRFAKKSAALPENLHFGFTADGRPYLVMPYYDGESFAEPIERSESMDPRQAAYLLLPISRLLELCHLDDVLHCDIRPANLLREDNQAVLIDWGSAKIGGLGHQSVHPIYSAPEVQNGEPADERSDVFSFAATFYAVLRGKHFESDMLPGADTEITIDRATDLPAPLLGLLVRCLDPDPNKRVQRFGKITTILTTIVESPRKPSEQQVDAAEVLSRQQTVKPSHRQIRWRTSAVAALLIGAIAGGYWYAQSSGSEEDTTTGQTVAGPILEPDEQGDTGTVEPGETTVPGTRTSDDAKPSISETSDGAKPSIPETSGGASTTTSTSSTVTSDGGHHREAASSSITRPIGENETMGITVTAPRDGWHFVDLRCDKATAPPNVLTITGDFMWSTNGVITSCSHGPHFGWALAGTSLDFMVTNGSEETNLDLIVRTMDAVPYSIQQTARFTVLPQDEHSAGWSAVRNIHAGTVHSYPFSLEEGERLTFELANCTGDLSLFLINEAGAVIEALENTRCDELPFLENGFSVPADGGYQLQLVPTRSSENVQYKLGPISR